MLSQNADCLIVPLFLMHTIHQRYFHYLHHLYKCHKQSLIIGSGQRKLIIIARLKTAFIVFLYGLSKWPSLLTIVSYFQSVIHTVLIILKSSMQHQICLDYRDRHHCVTMFLSFPETTKSAREAARQQRRRNYSQGSQSNNKKDGDQMKTVRTSTLENLHKKFYFMQKEKRDLRLSFFTENS